jgi:hypothetical protein
MPIAQNLQPASQADLPPIKASTTDDSASPAARGVSASKTSKRSSYWVSWAILTVFLFIAFECALLAVALKGSWFILLAPAAVCALKAWDAWHTLKRSLE